MKLILPTYLKKAVAYLLTLLMLLHIASCTYFRVKHSSQGDLPSLVEMGREHKYFVIHQGAELYHLEAPLVEDNILKGTLSDASADSIYYNDFRKELVKSSERSILNEIHIYPAADQEPFTVGEFAIPITKINEIRVIKSDSGQSIVTFLFATIGTMAIIGIIVALTKSSCPYVYVHDGEGQAFAGEMYGGAILKNLERDEGQFYRIYIANELKEEQFTNLPHLVIVDHPQNTSALLDQKGQAHLPLGVGLISSPQVG